jgi:hypothetical protein
MAKARTRILILTEARLGSSGYYSQTPIITFQTRFGSSMKSLACMAAIDWMKAEVRHLLHGCEGVTDVSGRLARPLPGQLQRKEARWRVRQPRLLHSLYR